MRARSTAAPGSRASRGKRSRRWLFYLLLGLGLPAILFGMVLAYYYVSFARIIDERLQGERVRALPRIFGRPYELRRGQGLSPTQLADRLNDLEYAVRTVVEKPGEFSIGHDTILLMVREGAFGGRTVRVTFRPLRAGPSPAQAIGTKGTDDEKPYMIERLEIVGGAPVDVVTLEPPLLTAFMKSVREKRRHVELSAIPARMVQAVIAIEDRRFYSHPGVDAIGIAGAVWTNVRGNRPYLVGGSTLTQQLVRNFFLTPEKSYKRKVLEQFMSVVLERRASKDEILELYLNDVYLGQRGSFAIHGVAEAARLFFAKDVSNITLGEAATIAGVIQTANHSPFNSMNRARERRNVVLRTMAECGFISQEAAERASHDPIKIVPPALENEAPYFTDYLGQVLADQYPAIANSSQAVDIYTTLDLHLQRLAQESVAAGVAQLDQQLARRRRTAQAALIALDPRTGEVLAMVGGRAYSQSQYNRAVSARRQPGSVFKPFVYLAAFEQAAEQGRNDLTPATMVDDEPTTFRYEDKEWTPANYEEEYDGMITVRRALAFSRNIATIKVAESIGYKHVSDLWNKIGAGTPPRPYPSIALGVFEASPLEIASAYTIFPNLGELQPPTLLVRATAGGSDVVKVASPPRRRVARADTTFLVTNMMRSVINEGTGATARALYGFALDAAGKTGTTNDMRDAWFVGFTPELLTVVWVGLDDNTVLGLSGARAALPIWSMFMNRALAGHANVSFPAPENIVFMEIDRDTGRVAVPGCPRVINEAFLPGTEPLQLCELHKF